MPNEYTSWGKQSVVEEEKDGKIEEGEKGGRGRERREEGKG